MTKTTIPVEMDTTMPMDERNRILMYRIYKQLPNGKWDCATPFSGTSSLLGAKRIAGKFKRKGFTVKIVGGYEAGIQI